MLNAEEFGWRLAEAIAWCTPCPREGDPGDIFWRPSLRPTDLSERPSYAEIQASYRRPAGQRGDYLDHYAGLYSHGLPARHKIVVEVCEARSAALRRESRYPGRPAVDLGGGRLLLFAPDDSLYDGAAEDATRGFFDSDNLPGWDTWVCYVEDAERTAQRRRWIAEPSPKPYGPMGFDSFVVSWVPRDLIDLVDFGIQVNPEGCVAWAEDVETAFTRQLRELGLL